MLQSSGLPTGSDEFIDGLVAMNNAIHDHALSAEDLADAIRAKITAGHQFTAVRLAMVQRAFEMVDDPPNLKPRIERR